MIELFKPVYKLVVCQETPEGFLILKEKKVSSSEYQTFGKYEANVLNIWCKKLYRNVRHPYEQCRLRKEKQKLTMQDFLKAKTLD